MLLFKAAARAAFCCALAAAGASAQSRRVFPISIDTVAAQSATASPGEGAEETDSQPAHIFQTTIRKLLDEEDFGRLEELAAAARSEKSRFLGGGWKLKEFYTVIENPGSMTATDAVWNAHIERLKRWCALNPDSATPRVALAQAYLRFAHKARGTGIGRAVTPDGQQIFAQRVATAYDVLQQAKALPNKDAQWYWAMQIVSLSQQWNRRQAEELLEQAAAFEPGYYYYYNRFQAYLFVNGKPGDIERFAQETADRIGGPEGDFVYFEMAMSINCCGVRTFLPGFSWDRVKQGFASLEQLYGSTNQQRNAIAFVALRMGDKEFAQTMFARIGDDWTQSVWGHKESFDQSKASLTLVR